jgi:hypothetical protein
MKVAEENQKKQPYENPRVETISLNDDMAVHKWQFINFVKTNLSMPRSSKGSSKILLKRTNTKLKNISLISHIRAYQPAVKHVAVLSRTLKKGDGSNSLTEIARQISSGEDHPERPRSSVGTLAGLSVIHLQFLIVVGL